MTKIVKKYSWLLVLLLICFISACKDPVNPGPGEQPDPGEPEPYPTELLMPGDLVYRGAFRLPGPSNNSSWEYSGAGATYYPGGDAASPDDGFPGSIFALGHDWHMYVSEISIPIPIDSPGKNPADLNRAQTLQGFKNVRAGVGQLENLQEIVRVGIEYLPKQPGQEQDLLYLCWGAHFQEDQEHVASHMSCNLNLGNSQGAWWVGERSLYSVNDYLFEIPESWTATNTPGKRLATGRFRDGGWSGQGPSIFAIGPWNHGDPPEPGTILDEVPLLLYSSSYSEEDGNYKMDNYHHSDEWTGAAWLTAGNKSAVIFVGTKGTGECWYGDSNGPCMDCPGDRGWWSTGFEGKIIFYDPADLAQTASGTMQPHEPQPYAEMDIDNYLYHIQSSQQKYHVRGLCYDRQRNFLYIFEFLADGDKCLVHVFEIK